ncbi:hypothetical protein KKD04_00390 [Patescibacteria group bacterium]|nr:hypothetical protein [Patescibacteria group bacterium]
MIKRIVFDIMLLWGLFLLPWWGAMILAVLGMFLFRKFWEAIVIAFLIDSFFSISESGFWGRFGIFTAGAIVLFFIIKFIKSKIRFLSKE